MASMLVTFRDDIVDFEPEQSSFCFPSCAIDIYYFYSSVQHFFCLCIQSLVNGAADFQNFKLLCCLYYIAHTCYLLFFDVDFYLSCFIYRLIPSNPLMPVGRKTGVRLTNGGLPGNYFTLDRFLMRPVASLY